MGSFKLGGMTFGSLFKKPETCLYPAEKKEAPAGLRGHIVIDESKCILCGICQKACPTGAITVDRKGRIWAIEPFRCILCDSCVRACPKQALATSPELKEIATGKYDSVHTIPDPKAAAAAAE